MIEWHLRKIEEHMKSVERRLGAALEYAQDNTLPLAQRFGFMQSAIAGTLHDIEGTMELHGTAKQEALPL